MVFPNEGSCLSPWVWELKETNMYMLLVLWLILGHRLDILIRHIWKKFQYSKSTNSYIDRFYQQHYTNLEMFGVDQKCTVIV